MARENADWDGVSERLKTEREVVAYIKAAFDSDNPKVVVAAFKTISHAKGISPALKRMRMTRTEFCAQVVPRGRPKVDIVMKLFNALGLKLKLAA